MLPEEKEKFQVSGNDENIRKKHVYDEKRKKRIRAAIMRTGLLAMLLVVSTYAWFTSQKDITLSNLRGTVEVSENMELSLDAKTWHQKIDLKDAINVFAEAQGSRDKALGEDMDTTTRTTAPALIPKELLPVSGIGEIGGNLLPLYTGTATSTSLADIKATTEIDGATKEAKNTGYFAFDIYIKNTSQDGEDDVLQLNLNSSVQVLAEDLIKQIMVNGTNVSRVYKGDSASGLQNTVRVGLALYGGEVSSTSTQLQILESTKGATIRDLAIWEPNASDHVEYIVSNNNKLLGNVVNGVATPLTFTTTEAIETYALKESAVTAGEITNVYDTKNENLGVQKTFQTEKTSSADYRVLSSDGKPLNIQNIGEEDFKIKSNAISRLRVYVWLEGQDVDCINVASQGGGIEIDLGFTKDNEVGDVLDEEVIETTLASATNDNIGQYIDLGNDIVDYNGTTGKTTDDWRILYVENDTVYAILSSYLPAEDIPVALSLDTDPTNYPYSVWSNSDGSILVEGLTNSTEWNGLANGITGATVQGTPTGNLLMKSFNIENGTNLEINENLNLNTNSTTGDLSLYVPHYSVSGEKYDNCEGYWLTDLHPDGVFSVDCQGISTNRRFTNTTFAARPVVSLPKTTEVTKTGKLWAVKNHN